MLDNKFEKGFTRNRLESMIEPRVKKDERGFYLLTLSENVPVYFDDFYRFLAQVYYNCVSQMEEIERKIEETPQKNAETLSFYRARMIIINIVKKNALMFYMDSSNFGVIMTPWCFGTVVLEKTEMYRDRIARGDAHDPNVPDFPYDVIRYLDEITKATLLELFKFPENAFQMRWQYSELVRRYTKVLGNITDSLQSVLLKIRNYQP
ncbi:MAG: hypothetical protein IIB00_04730 [candidate division Zixibacteria bacterium]|nr:hypothetical protein [candidate division Zixibacteria bacterium]